MTGFKFVHLSRNYRVQHQFQLFLVDLHCPGGLGCLLGVPQHDPDQAVYLPERRGPWVWYYVQILQAQRLRMRSPAELHLF